jgi:hypothetical protein
MALGWRGEKDPSSMKYDDVKDLWNDVPSSLARAYLDFVWSNTNITEDQKVEFTYGVLTDSRGSLQTADEAARMLSKKFQIDYNAPLNFTAFHEWWKQWSATNISGADQPHKLDGSKE